VNLNRLDRLVKNTADPFSATDDEVVRTSRCVLGTDDHVTGTCARR